MILLIILPCILIVSYYTKTARKLNLSETRWSIIGLLSFIFPFLISFGLSFKILLYLTQPEDSSFDSAATFIEGISLLIGIIVSYIFIKINTRIMKNNKSINDDGILDNIDF